MSPVLPQKPDHLAAIFDQPKPIMGMIHLAPLPGAPRYDGQPVEDIYAAAVADALTMAKAGIDGIIVENAFDLPFARPESIGPETVAALTAACVRVRDAVDLPIGITCVAKRERRPPSLPSDGQGWPTSRPRSPGRPGYGRLAPRSVLKW